MPAVAAEGPAEPQGIVADILTQLQPVLERVLAPLHTRLDGFGRELQEMRDTTQNALTNIRDVTQRDIAALAARVDGMSTRAGSAVGSVAQPAPEPAPRGLGGLGQGRVAPVAAAPAGQGGAGIVTTAIIGGFPFDSRRAAIEEIVTALCRDMPNAPTPTEVWTPWRRGSTCFARFDTADDMWTWIRHFKMAERRGLGRVLWAGRRRTAIERQRATPVSRVLRCLRAALPEGTEIEGDNLSGKVWVGDVQVAKRLADYQMEVDRDALGRVMNFDGKVFDDAWARQD